MFKTCKIQLHRNQKGQQTRLKDTNEFWSNLWSKPKQHNEDAQWLPKVEDKLRDTHIDENLIVSQRTVKIAARKMQNCKTPGTDRIHGYWIKTNLHERPARQLQSILEGNVPEWIVEV